MALDERFEHRVVGAGGSSMAVWSSGDGPPVLLLHGFGQTHEHGAWWRPILPSPSPSTVRTLPGYGDSTAPPAAWRERFFKRATVTTMVDV